MVVPVLSFPDQPGEIVRAIEHRIEAQGVACRGNDRCHHRPGKVDGPEARIEPLDPAALHLVFGFRSEEHTSELQSLMRISYAVFCLKKKKKITKKRETL